MEYLKKAAKTPETETGNARKVVDEMLAEIGAAARRRCASTRGSSTSWERRDRGDEPTRSSAARATIDAGVKRDIEFATAQVRRFALAQRESMQEFSTEVHPGLTAGPAPDPGERRRLLRAHRPLRAHRHRLHDDRHRQGRGRADGGRLLDAVSRARASIRTCSTR